MITLNLRLGTSAPKSSCSTFLKAWSICLLHRMGSHMPCSMRPISAVHAELTRPVRERNHTIVLQHLLAQAVSASGSAWASCGVLLALKALLGALRLR